MTWTLVVLKRAKKDIAELPQSIRERVRALIDSFAQDPFPHNSKELEGKWKGYRSAREGEYRVIYTTVAQILTVTVVRVRKRGDVYR